MAFSIQPMIGITPAQTGHHQNKWGFQQYTFSCNKETWRFSKNQQGIWDWLSSVLAAVHAEDVVMWHKPQVLVQGLATTQCHKLSMTGDGLPIYTNLYHPSKWRWLGDGKHQLYPPENWRRPPPVWVWSPSGISGCWLTLNSSRDPRCGVIETKNLGFLDARYICVYIHTYIYMCIGVCVDIYICV